MLDFSSKSFDMQCAFQVQFQLDIDWDRSASENRKCRCGNDGIKVEMTSALICFAKLKAEKIRMAFATRSTCVVKTFEAFSAPAEEKRKLSRDSQSFSQNRFVVAYELIRRESSLS